MAELIEVVEINDKKILDELLKQHNIIYLLDFYAKWCNPCKILLPQLVTLLNNYKDKNVKLIKINIDEADFVDCYNIQQLPTIVLIHNNIIQNFIVSTDINIIENILKKYIDNIS